MYRASVDAADAHAAANEQAQASVPVAVALSFDCDFDETIGSESARAAFDEQVQNDVSAALGVPKEAIEVLCHQRGSVIAEVILKAVDGGGAGSSRPTAAHALAVLV